MRIFRTTLGQVVTGLLLILSSNSSGTIYRPLSIEDQIDSASAVIRGVFSGKAYKKLPSGEIITENYFQILESAGVAKSEIVNPAHFRVITPGGLFQGINHKVIDGPEFVEGEEVYLLLKKGMYGMWIKDLALGKYNKVTKDGEIFLKSAVFPNHPELGAISLEKFNILLSGKFGEKLRAIHGDKIVTKVGEHKIGRTPASSYENFDAENEKDDGMPYLFLSALLLGMLGLVAKKIGKGT